MLNPQDSTNPNHQLIRSFIKEFGYTYKQCEVLFFGYNFPQINKPNTFGFEFLFVDAKTLEGDVPYDHIHQEIESNPDQRLMFMFPIAHELFSSLSDPEKSFLLELRQHEDLMNMLADEVEEAIPKSNFARGDKEPLNEYGEVLPPISTEISWKMEGAYYLYTVSIFEPAIQIVGNHVLRSNPQGGFNC